MYRRVLSAAGASAPESRNTSKEALLPDDGGRVEGDGCGGWRGAATGCGAEDGTRITPPGRMRVCGRLAGCSLE